MHSCAPGGSVLKRDSAAWAVKATAVESGARSARATVRETLPVKWLIERPIVRSLIRAEYLLNLGDDIVRIALFRPIAHERMAVQEQSKLRRWFRTHLLGIDRDGYSHLAGAAAAHHGVAARCRNAL